MRRNWLTVTLFVLALVVQTFAPAMGRVAVTKGVVASASVQLCVAEGAAGEQKQTPGKANHHRDFCPLCQFLCDGGAPLAARVAFNGAAPVASRVLAWAVIERRLPVPDFDYARQARAPPVIS